VYVPLLLVAHFYALKILGQRSGEKRGYPPGVNGRRGAAAMTATVQACQVPATRSNLAK
jgi:hypothetical protein